MQIKLYRCQKLRTKLTEEFLCAYAGEQRQELNPASAPAAAGFWIACCKNYCGPACLAWMLQSRAGVCGGQRCARTQRCACTQGARGVCCEHEVRMGDRDDPE